MKAMKLLILAVMMTGTLVVAEKASAAEHKFTGHAAVASDYHWRGRSLDSGGNAHLSGGLNYNRMGFDLGAWMGQIAGGNLTSTGATRAFQSNWYLAWNKRVHDEIWIRPQVTWYTFLGGGGAYDDTTIKGTNGKGSNNMVEYGLQVSWKWVTVGFTRLDSYFGADTKADRVFIAGAYDWRKWTFGASFGHNDFDKTEKFGELVAATNQTGTGKANFGFENYWDLELSATRHFGATDFKVAFWTTDRQATGNNGTLLVTGGSEKNLSDNAWVLTVTQNF